MGPIVAYSLIAAIALVGLWLVREGIVRGRAANARFDEASRWPRAEATVLHSDLIQQSNDPEVAPFWEPRLRYRFAVSGTAWEGDQVTLNARDYLNDAEGKRWFADHAPGSTIGVFYDPADPARNAAEINRANRTSSMFRIGGGILCLLLAGGMVVGAG